MTFCLKTFTLEFFLLQYRAVQWPVAKSRPHTKYFTIVREIIAMASCWALQNGNRKVIKIYSTDHQLIGYAHHKPIKKFFDMVNMQKSISLSAKAISAMYSS